RGVPANRSIEAARPVGQHPVYGDRVLFEERQDTVVQQVGRGDRRLAIVELGETNLGVSVDRRLLVNAPDPLHGADIEGVLRHAITRALAPELAAGFLLLLGLLQRAELAVNTTPSWATGLEHLQPLLHGLQVMAQPDAAHPERRDRQAALAQLVGRPGLT